MEGGRLGKKGREVGAVGQDGDVVELWVAGLRWGRKGVVWGLVG